VTLKRLLGLDGGKRIETEEVESETAETEEDPRNRTKTNVATLANTDLATNTVAVKKDQERAEL